MTKTVDTKTYPLLVEEDSSYQKRIEMTQEDIKSEEGYKRTAAYLARLFLAQRRMKKDAEELLKDVNLRLEAIVGLLDEVFDEQGLEAVRVDGRLVMGERKVFPTIVDPEAFRKWCIEEGLEKKLSLHHSTARSMIEQLLDAGEDVPPGVKVYLKPAFKPGPAPRS